MNQVFNMYRSVGNKNVGSEDWAVYADTEDRYDNG